MKVVILAGGLGTRLSEETVAKPKPMVEIGGRPVLWHIMKSYESFGLTDFIICCGYKGYLIKEYFANYALHLSDVTFNLETGEKIIHKRRGENWNVTLIDTGENSMTGGRLARVKEFVGDDDFCFTYGDGVADVDIASLISFHRSHGRLATMTACYPPGRFGALDIVDNRINQFKEKPRGDGGVVNGGFFVLNPKIFDFIEGDSTVWEQEPLNRLAEDGELMAFEHDGFWQPMDTLRDKNLLDKLWSDGAAPWCTWK
jgi:glucose-1-phosphate cytidylyltransferase